MHQVDCYTSALCTGAWMPGWPHRMLTQSARAPSMQAPMVTTMACLQIRHVMIHRGSMKTTKTRKHVCGAGALAPEPRRRHSPAPAAPLCTNPKKSHEDLRRAWAGGGAPSDQLPCESQVAN